MGDHTTRKKRVKSGGSGHAGHIPEQFHDRVQTPMVALFVAVPTRAGIGVLEPLNEELMVQGNNHLQVDHTCCQAGVGFRESLDN